MGACPVGWDVLRVCSAPAQSFPPSQCHRWGLTGQGSDEDLPQQLGLLRRPRIRGSEHVPFRPDLPGHNGDKLALCPHALGTRWASRCWYLAERSSRRAWGTRDSRRHSWIRSRASARCSSTGVSEAASKGTTSSGRGTSPWMRTGRAHPVPHNTLRAPRGAGPFPGTSRQAWSCGANPSHSCSSSALLGWAGAAGARGFFFFLRTRLL